MNQEPPSGPAQPAATRDAELYELGELLLRAPRGARHQYLALFIEQLPPVDFMQVLEPALKLWLAIDLGIPRDSYSGSARAELERRAAMLKPKTITEVVK